MDRSGSRFRPRFVGVKYGRKYDPGMRLYPSRVALAHADSTGGITPFGTNLLEKPISLWRGVGQWVEVESADRMPRGGGLCKASSNAITVALWLRDSLGIVGNAQYATVTTRRGPMLHWQ